MFRKKIIMEEYYYKRDVRHYRKMIYNWKKSKEHISILIDKLIKEKNEEVEWAKEFQRGR